MDMKFFKCSHCGNIVAYVQSNGPKVSCCGEEMKELVANTTDAATEKHVPVVEIDGNLVTVSVGSVTHPMEGSTTSSGSASRPSRATSARLLSPVRSPRSPLPWHPATSLWLPMSTATSTVCGRRLDFLSMLCSRALSGHGSFSREELASIREPTGKKPSFRCVCNVLCDGKGVK